MDVEVDDWEVLTDSVDSVQNTSCLEGIEGESEGIIRSDYFSLDSHTKYASIQGDDDISVESDNPSWIDPAVCDTRYSVTKETGEFWSSDGSEDGKYASAEFEAKNNEPDIIVDISEAAEMGTSVQLGSASGKVKYEKFDTSNIFDDLTTHDKSEPPFGEDKTAEARGQGENGGEERNRGAIWWKLPLDLLKYCLFRASPVWTLSVAAAMVGVLILGRRLYQIKRRSRTLQLKVTVDDKKVSQYMSRAARLNEAFSVVKLVPMIRPALPAAAGVAPCP